MDPMEADEAEPLGAEDAPVRARVQPNGPGQEELQRHLSAGHVPYRSWCRACIAGRGRGDHHFDQPPGAYSIIGIDYAYLHAKGEIDTEVAEGSFPMVVMKDKVTGLLFGEVVPSKGLAHPWSELVVAEILAIVGWNKFVFRSDGEASIVALKGKALAVLRNRTGADCIMEETAADDHQANGLAENAVRDLKGQIRTLVFALAETYKAEIGNTHPIMPWLVRHAALSLNRGQVGRDGKTPHERHRGVKYRRQLPPFGEVCMRKLGDVGPARAEAKWERGIFLGTAHRSNEVYVSHEAKVVLARSIRRLPEAEAVDLTLLDQLRGSPWKMDPVEAVAIPPGVMPAPVEVPPPPAPPGDIKIPRTYIRKDIELRKFGYTLGCPGCEAAQAGLRARAHSEICRTRIEEELSKTEDGSERIGETALRAEARLKAKRTAEEFVAAEGGRKSPRANGGASSSGAREMPMEDAAGPAAAGSRGVDEPPARSGSDMDTAMAVAVSRLGGGPLGAMTQGRLDATQVLDLRGMDLRLMGRAQAALVIGAPYMHGSWDTRPQRGLSIR